MFELIIAISPFENDHVRDCEDNIDNSIDVMEDKKDDIENIINININIHCTPIKNLR